MLARKSEEVASVSGIIAKILNEDILDLAFSLHLSNRCYRISFLITCFSICFATYLALSYLLRAKQCLILRSLAKVSSAFKYAKERCDQRKPHFKIF